jgi:hypothetical protein
MQLLYRDQLFDAQLLRTVGHTPPRYFGVKLKLEM